MPKPDQMQEDFGTKPNVFAFIAVLSFSNIWGSHYWLMVNWIFIGMPAATVVTMLQHKLF